MSLGTLAEAHLVERNDMLRDSAAVGSDRDGDQYSHYLCSAPSIRNQSAAHLTSWIRWKLFSGLPLAQLSECDVLSNSAPRLELHSLHPSSASQLDTQPSWRGLTFRVGFRVVIPAWIIIVFESTTCNVIGFQKFTLRRDLFPLHPSLHPSLRRTLSESICPRKLRPRKCVRGHLSVQICLKAKLMISI